MACTGACLFLFALAHMLGNLMIFLGAEELNAYAHILQTTPEILYPARLGLGLCATIHVWVAIRLTLENRAARPIRYEQDRCVAASYASRTMIWSGAILLAFVVYHLLHFTVKSRLTRVGGVDFHLMLDCQGRPDVFRMIVTSFSQPAVALAYVAAVGMLAWHISHGVQAFLQSLGLNGGMWRPVIDHVGTIAAWVLFAGFASAPVAVLLGYGKEVLK
jgi:succinate dehydrogenase / fumarate reductase cytochrome b subunit